MLSVQAVCNTVKNTDEMSSIAIIPTALSELQGLTLSSPIPLRLYTLPYWSNPPFLIFDIRAHWRSGLSARAPECQKLKNGGLDQYGAGPFEPQQFGTAGVEWVKPGQ